jgi:hypothetical protein
MGSIQVRITPEHRCKTREKANTGASLLNTPLAGPLTTFEHVKTDTNADVAYCSPRTGDLRLPFRQKS